MRGRRSMRCRARILTSSWTGWRRRFPCAGSASDSEAVAMRLLFCGDLVGRAGRTVVTEMLPRLRRDLALDFVVVNGENAAGGFGITEQICQQLHGAGADVITTGNHVWDQKGTVAFDRLAGCRLGEQADAILVDFHAEATSEKQAFGYHLDGKVSAVVGSHTHVPT